MPYQQNSLITVQPLQLQHLQNKSHSIKQTSGQQISQLYNEIHKTIGDMDSKVEHVIKKHQSEFLFAYRSHIKKIKKELAQIKYKSEQQQKMFSANDRIQYLEKELFIFREETMKLYNKLSDKTHELDLAKNRIKQYEKDASFKQQELKQQIKKNKFEEMNKSILKDQIQSLKQKLKTKQMQIAKLNTTIHSQKNPSIIGYSQNQFPTNQTKMLSPRSKSPKIQKISSNNIKGFYSSSNIYETDLKQWFLECIKTVKRQIAFRNNNQKEVGDLLNNITGIEQFMMVDKLRLLQIFLQNQKLLTWMYQRIFPDRLSSLRNKINSSKLSQYVKEKQQGLTSRQASNLKDIQSTFNFNNQEQKSDRYDRNSKVSMNMPIPLLPKVSRTSEYKLKQSQNLNLDGSKKNNWKGNVILKNGKLNISLG